MTSALASYSTVIKIGDGASSEAFTTIAEVMDINGPNLQLATADVTSHDSSGWREHVATILDGGDVTFSINFVPTGGTHDYSTGLVKDMTDRTLRNFQLVFPDSGSTTWTFAAYITGFASKNPVDGALTADVALRITGQPTLA